MAVRDIPHIQFGRGDRIMFLESSIVDWIKENNKPNYDKIKIMSPKEKIDHERVQDYYQHLDIFIRLPQY